MLRLVLVFLASGLASGAAAQTQEILFPGQSGAELRASIRTAYRPTSVSGTNDNLYATVDRTSVGGQDGVICVYTGLFVPFDGVPNSDPSQDVFNNGSGINQEHTFPQSFLNSSQARADLHNLFPTRVSTNGDRGNLPFAEIPDALTTRWYRETTATSTAPPEADRDEWSELRSGVAFEPREVHEGNVARAMYYMATVWDDVASLTWFEDQKDDLFEWHRADPVDQAEVDRSERVAAFQSGCASGACVNPFVVDSTLIRRAYYPEIVVVAGETAPEASGLALAFAGPNPSAGATRVRVAARTPVRVSVVDALGREVALLHDGPLAGGDGVLLVGPLVPGVYAVRAVSPEAALTLRLVQAR